jgi:CheY-like chemotaxis protein
VRLPVAHVQKDMRAAARAPQPAARASGHRVLIVDDNQDFANSLAMILRAMDNDVRVAHDGVAGLAIAQEWHPDVGFLDIGMPKLNGYDLARRLRASAGTSAMALVAITGWGQEKDRRDAVSAGFDHHLVKPAEPDRILEILGKVAGKPA